MMRVFRNWLRAVGYAGLVGLWHTRTCSTPFRLEMKNRSMRPLVVVPHRRITGSPFGSMLHVGGFNLAVMVTMDDSGSGGGGPRVVTVVA